MYAFALTRYRWRTRKPWGTVRMPVMQILGANPQMRRKWLAHNTGHAFEAAAEAAFAAEQVRGNIENLVGATHVPLGVAGPIRVNGEHAQGSFYVPFATTEGTLVSTYQYGMRAITEAGGANAYVLADSLDITPCFVLADAGEAIAFARWLHEHLDELKAVADATTAHGRLIDLDTAINLPRPYGKEVVVDCTLPAAVVETHLGVSTRELLDFVTAG